MLSSSKYISTRTRIKKSNLVHKILTTNFRAFPLEQGSNVILLKRKKAQKTLGDKRHVNRNIFKQS
jgi:hypothetical protein